ncbi:MAG: hypothetical protein R3230_06880 [Nitrosopumilaceae archaeon]|nr:hypothetical protein [Nitrosopumilaceae archaeon]
MSLMQKLSNSVLLKKNTLTKLVILFSVFGTIQMLSGGIWDASSHAVKAPEFFWSTQHVAVYAGVAMIACSAIVGFFMIKQNQIHGMFKNGVQLIIVGAILQIVSGYADSISHDVFGIDGLLSWSHQPLELGLVFSAIGAFLVLKSNPHSKFRLLLPLSIMMVLLSIMWLGFNLALLVGAHLLCVPVYEIFSSGCAIL